MKMSIGYTGRILRLNLTNKSTTVIDTEPYEQWGGGHGIGSALFWDLCEDKTIDGFDPRNVITIMTSPLTGTLAPGVSARFEMQGIGVLSYPIGWFARSNVGGHFGGMLKAAGWDGMVIEGAADAPVWINIINDQVIFEDARSLWGLDTWETQQEIWKMVIGDAGFDNWCDVTGYPTTQKPTILCIGPAGENLSRSAAIIHGSGNAAALSGFGAVWGSKNLKAISVQGTGGIKIANPMALIDARLWLERNYFHHKKEEESGHYGCQGCLKLCRQRGEKYANGSMCLETAWYGMAFGDIKVEREVSQHLGELAQRYGINISDLAIYTNDFLMHHYLVTLYNMGVLGPGKEIDSHPLPFEKLGSFEFGEALVKAIAYREGIGADLAEGPSRAAEKWGRLEQDLESGILRSPQWGYSYHSTLPCVEWPYGSVLGERDITEHDFEYVTLPGKSSDHKLERIRPLGMEIFLEEQSPESVIELLASKTIPYTGDPLMFNYAWQEADGRNMAQALENGIYSRHKAKLVAWHRHYTRFWKEAIGYCDWMYANFISAARPDHSGYTPEAEPKFLNAVTGGNMSFAEGVETGRRIWNLDRAIWILQGRHRNMEKLSGFLFKPGGSMPRPQPVLKNGKWRLDIPLGDMFLDKKGVETFMTHFCEFEGWDPESGWPSRSTLEELNLKNVADRLEKAGRLGISGIYNGK